MPHRIQHTAMPNSHPSSQHTRICPVEIGPKQRSAMQLYHAAPRVQRTSLDDSSGSLHCLPAMFRQECTECGETRNATDHCDKSRINRCECILRQSIPRQNGHLPIWSAKPKAPIHLDPMRAIAVDTPHNMSEVTSNTCGHDMLILC